MEPWLPEDDFLLKNAVEAGASLESLAKGAVQFSRRYSLTEIRDRWRALLYDPAVSAAAVAAMAQLDLAKYHGAALNGGDGGGGKKRKAQSIRKHYYAVQRRLRRCSVIAVSDDAKNAVVEEEEEEEGPEGKEKLVIDDNLSLNSGVVNNSLGVGKLSNSVSEFPLRKTIEDFSLPVHVSVEGGKSCGLEGRVNLKGECGNGGLKLNVSDAVLRDDAENDLGIEDGLLFMDVDRKEVVTGDEDKPCDDNVDSLLLSSPCDGDGRESHKLDGELRLASDGLEVVANPLAVSCGEQHCVSESGNNAGSSGAVQRPHPEHSEGFMICVLNTEDTNIPCNDGTSVSIALPDLAYVVNNLSKEPDASLKKEPALSQSFPALQTVRQGLVPNVNSGHPPVVLGLRSENPGRNSISAVSRQNNNVNVNPSHGRLVRATVIPASDGHLKQEETIAPASAHVKAEEHKALSKSEAKSLSLNQEGGDIDDDDNDDDDADDDDEFPNFSDAEEMILEMDLSPMDRDTNTDREVLRYQLEQSKRTLMRLEQGAQSFMGRDISSQGAFAVVYGRILRNYISKRKVILGRATNDIKVDIDLGKEGQEAATKISRKQAVITMESDGSFIIKNLGKKSIFLNGKEIATGQARVLSAGSLIEISGISLIFETNSRCVKKFLENENEQR